MTTHTAEDFRNSRFATHPDGRIAARIDYLVGRDLPWRMSGDTPTFWASDADMARDGWSPLDETRAEVIQHEFTITGHMDPDDVARAIQRQMDKRAALSAAPTTDEDDTSVDYHAMWWRAEREREKAERERDEAVDRAKKAGREALFWKDHSEEVGDSAAYMKQEWKKAETERDEARAETEGAPMTALESVDGLTITIRCEVNQ